MYTTLLRLWCLASFRSVISESASDIDPVTPQYPKHAVIVDGATVSPSNHLAVVVPTHRGELPRAVSSLQRWPSSCSPVTKRSVDLVLYYAEGDEDNAVVAEAVQAIASTAGLCFATTRVVYANVNEELGGGGSPSLDATRGWPFSATSSNECGTSCPYYYCINEINNNNTVDDLPVLCPFKR